MTTAAVGDRVRVIRDLRADDPKSKWAKRRRGRPGRVIRTQARTVHVHFTDAKFPEEAWMYPEELELEGTANDTPQSTSARPS